MAEDDIRREVRERGIKRLCHFTRSEALPSIFEYGGILSDVRLLRSDIEFAQNDHERWDQHPNHVSCTIQYPNVYLLNSWRQKTATDWVVIVIKPSPLWTDGACFSPVNAATKMGADISTGAEGFKQMFDDHPRDARYPRGQNHLQSCPTDVQAEVLIPDQITTSLIQAIVVPDQMQASRERARLRDVPLPEILGLGTCPEFFNVHDLVSRIRNGKMSALNATMEHF